ncbi:Zinc finger, C2H2 type [Popillia japonica]|uniref:Zinc finger, C2H2 type n=1 Tax=Popillia japonica TaxID=7064 RepID=A0AAW1MD76_POPJA
MIQLVDSIRRKTLSQVAEAETCTEKNVHELTGVRLPLQPYTGGHAVFMYSTAADGNVTLQLKEPDDLDRSSLAAMLARLQDDASFSISYQDTDILSDGSIDVLLGTGTGNVQTQGGNEAVTATFDLFDSSNGPDLTLSPQTFTNSTEAFINDNSNSLGVPADNEAVSSTDEKKHAGTTTEVVKLTVKRARPKAASPNRQGPQQCQVCSKVFGNASALAKHKLTHSDERKYVCTMCGKAFKRQDHLNGHMLTHRNKKPYECKAEGCGKSYCDARSLRRHTENHHSSNASNTTMSPAQGAASGDAASPHGSSCIQYAPPPSTPGGKSQLQQLLATEPAANGGSNDGLTKQQLDLIHHIMEQSQRQSHSVTKSNSKSSTKQVTKSSSIKAQRVWTSTFVEGAVQELNTTDIEEHLLSRNEELTNEELIGMLEKNDEDEVDNDDDVLPPKRFKMDALDRDFSLSQEIDAILVENDPVMERSVRFKRQIEEAISPYRELYNSLKSKNKQTSIISYLKRD